MNGVTRAAVVRWASAVSYYTGLLRGATLTVGYATRPAFPILIYHRVNDDQDRFFPSIPTSVFERHIQYIARTYRVLTVEALVERMRRGALPRNALAITFDDGYRDTLTHAAPILARFGLPATVFLATGFIGTAAVPWYDRIAMAFKTTQLTSFLAPWNEVLSLASEAERLRALDRMLAYFKRLPDADLERGVDDLLDTLGATRNQLLKSPMLTWDDVHALTGLGFSIGAHTVTHPILSRISPQRAWMEIVGCRTTIASALGTPPKAFAYPNGRPKDYNETVKQIVREAGFSCAVSTRFGVNTASTPVYDLRRGGPWEHDLPTFAMKLSAYRVVARHPKRSQRGGDGSSSFRGPAGA